LEKVCDAVPNYDMETKLGDFISKDESLSYIQHVEDTAFTTKQIMMENEW
jgi:hypothetical protein